MRQFYASVHSIITQPRYLFDTSFVIFRQLGIFGQFI